MSENEGMMIETGEVQMEGDMRSDFRYTTLGEMMEKGV
jgi:hypothetical protein